MISILKVEILLRLLEWLLWFQVRNGSEWNPRLCLSLWIRCLALLRRQGGRLAHHCLVDLLPPDPPFQDQVPFSFLGIGDPSSRNREVEIVRQQWGDIQRPPRGRRESTSSRSLDSRSNNLMQKVIGEQEKVQKCTNERKET